jgi:hypothetical protein
VSSYIWNDFEYLHNKNFYCTIPFWGNIIISISGTSSALLSDNMSTADGEGRKSLDVVVTVAGVKGIVEKKWR